MLHKNCLSLIRDSPLDRVECVEFPEDELGCACGEQIRTAVPSDVAESPLELIRDSGNRCCDDRVVLGVDVSSSRHEELQVE